MRSRSVVAALLVTVTVGVGCADQLDVATFAEAAVASTPAISIEGAIIVDTPIPLELAGESVLVVHAAQATTTLGFLGVPVFTGTGWALGTSTNAVTYPVQAAVGDVLTGAAVYFQRSNATAQIVAQVQKVDNATGIALPLGNSVVEASGSTGAGVLQLPLTGPTTVDGGWSLAVVAVGLGTAGVTLGNVAIAKQQPPIVRPVRTLEIGAPEGIAHDQGPLFHGRWWDASVPFFVYFPIALPVGSEIRSWRMTVLKYSTAERIEATLACETAFSEIQIGAAQTVTGSPGPVTIGQTITVPVEPDHTYYVKVASTPGALLGQDLFYRLTITYVDGN
jgi:hypothetical protein